ncbi:MAG TPA: 1-acyl-sn-glycerol-3-phosphate acyltransferase [Bacteroidia bacterium]|nr:1-acyl-sn-glycerol-3-phosphate acyltransferase [Bacteroidia bacterium]
MFKLLFKLGKWKITNYLPSNIKKCVIIGAPHTSNWDFVYGMGALQIMKLRTRFTIKKEWIRFPFKGIMDSLGALPIDRTAIKTGEKRGSVDAIADLFATRDELLLLITPEGTRAKMEKWKTGFYYIALKAKVPIALGFMDYKTRTCGIDKIIYPSGDFKADMKLVMDFYKTIGPKNPQNFSVDIEFA